MDSGELDYWRNYFKSANVSVIELIEKAITVAALDFPHELQLYRVRIAETLYCHRWPDSTRVLPENKERVTKNRLDSNASEIDDKGCENRLFSSFGKLEGGGTIETKVDSTKNGSVDSIFCDHEAEALTDKIEEENLVVFEVLRIKEVLDNSKDQSDTMLFESLRKLQLMALSVDILKATEIGKVVNCLRKHGSKRICQLARTLIKDWRKTVDEWVNATQVVAVDMENFNDSMNPSLIDDGIGLPLPPLDEGAFFTNPFSKIDLLSEFFEGMDDEGNPQSGAEFKENHDNGKTNSLDNREMSKQKLTFPKEATMVVNDIGVTMKQESVGNVTKQPNSEERKVNQESGTVIISKSPSLIRDHDYSDEAAVEKKLEATRRKLHQGYQQAQNAKKQRTIQVMDLHELPKQQVVRDKTPRKRKQNNFVRRLKNGRT